MVGPNHGRRIVLLGGIEAPGSDEPTIKEWLSRPNVAANRGEVAAYGESLVRNEVAYLVKFVVDRKQAEMTERARRMIAEALEEYDAQRWYRRLWRWATYPFLPKARPGDLLMTGEVIRKVKAEAKMASDGPWPAPPPQRVSADDADAIDKVVQEGEHPDADAVGE